LVDRADAVGLGVLGIVEGDGLALDQHRAGIGLIGPGEDFDEGGLAGPVFPEQRMHLARPQAEIDMVERGISAEDLEDLLRLERVAAIRHCPSPKSLRSAPARGMTPWGRAGRPTPPRLSQRYFISNRGPCGAHIRLPDRRQRYRAWIR